MHHVDQARQAEQYQVLQGERLVRDAEWKALEYRGLDARVQALKEKASDIHIEPYELELGFIKVLLGFTPERAVPGCTDSSALSRSAVARSPGTGRTRRYATRFWTNQNGCLNRNS